MTFCIAPAAPPPAAETWGCALGTTLGRLFLALRPRRQRARGPPRHAVRGGRESEHEEGRWEDDVIEREAEGMRERRDDNRADAQDVEHLHSANTAHSREGRSAAAGVACAQRRDGGGMSCWWLSILADAQMDSLRLPARESHRGVVRGSRKTQPKSPDQTFFRREWRRNIRNTTELARPLLFGFSDDHLLQKVTPGSPGGPRTQFLKRWLGSVHGRFIKRDA
ncbi:hypothetical protein DFH09DRAFT_1502347 [Mycena vulgaris]|nr:hypothetical protein DFH09DRAFT_1502347 [Mycena vulgaris]